MHRLESGVLNTYQLPTSYSRYVDDIYNQDPDDQGADEFHLAMNLLTYSVRTNSQFA